MSPEVTTITCLYAISGFTAAIAGFKFARAEAIDLCNTGQYTKLQELGARQQSNTTLLELLSYATIAKLLAEFTPTQLATPVILILGAITAGLMLGTIIGGATNSTVASRLISAHPNTPTITVIDAKSTTISYRPAHQPDDQVSVPQLPG